MIWYLVRIYFSH